MNVLVKMAGTAGLAYLAYRLMKAKPPASPVPSARRPLFGITVWKLSQLPNGWAGMFERQGWDFVSLKVCDGRAEFQPQSVLTMVQQLQARGVTLHGWGFHYCKTVGDARIEARTAADICNRYHLFDYHWNAEKHWANASDPESAAIAFAQEFRGLTGGRVRLWANAYTTPMTKRILAGCGGRPCFDVWEPMMYGTRPATIDRHTHRRLNKFGGAGEAPVARAMMVATGNVKEKETEFGTVEETWGFFYDRGNTPGLLSLVQRERPYAVNYWRAPINLTSGNAQNPSVARQLAEMKTAFSSTALV